jgi:hypothetical protein
VRVAARPSSASRSSRTQLGRAGQRLGDAAVQGLLQPGQHLGAQPYPGEARVGVVRVVPVGQVPGRAGGAGGLPADPEQRAQPAAVDRAHAGDRPRPGAAAEPEQHGLGLVVEGVREQDGAVAGGLGEGGVAGAAGGRLRTPASPTSTRRTSTGSSPSRRPSSASRPPRPRIPPAGRGRRSPARPARRAAAPRTRSPRRARPSRRRRCTRPARRPAAPRPAADARPPARRPPPALAHRPHPAR